MNVLMQFLKLKSEFLIGLFHHKKSYLLTLIFCVFFVLSCENLFNPSGDGSSKNLDANGLISYGESLLRENRPADAEVVFKKALVLDSTKSLAYFGLGKSILRKNNINPATLAELMLEIEDAQKDSSANGNQVLTVVKNFLGRLPNLSKGIKEMSIAIKPFILRDSINTEWKNSTLKSSKYSASQFPLVDGIIPGKRLMPEYQIGTFIGLIDNFIKVSNILKIDNPDSLLIQFQNGSLDLSDIDSTQATTLNDALSSIGTDATKLSEFASDLMNQSDSSSNSDSTKPSDEEIQEKIKSLGNTTVFYRFGDKKDNDGDYAVDEEALDGKDNDGDGLIDEDARLTMLDFFDNNVNAKVDDSSELIDLTSKLLPVSFGYKKGSLLLYLDSSLADTDKKLRQDKVNEYRLSVLADSSTRLISSSEKCLIIGGLWCSVK